MGYRCLHSRSQNESADLRLEKPTAEMNKQLPSALLHVCVLLTRAGFGSKNKDQMLLPQGACRHYLRALLGRMAVFGCFSGCH